MNADDILSKLRRVRYRLKWKNENLAEIDELIAHFDVNTRQKPHPVIAAYQLKYLNQGTISPVVEKIFESMEEKEFWEEVHRPIFLESKTPMELIEVTDWKTMKKHLA